MCNCNCEVSKITVKPATIKDIPGMAGLLAELFALEKDFKADREKQESGLGMFLSCEGRAAFVAQKDGRLAGMVTGQLMASTAEGAQSVLVEDLVTDPEYRGKGVGSRLLAAVEKWGRDKGAVRLQLLADRDNAPARTFYEKAGWELTNLICLKKTEPAAHLCSGTSENNN